jgi:hypothetical protein
MLIRHKRKLMTSCKNRKPENRVVNKKGIYLDDEFLPLQNAPVIIGIN